MKRMLCVASLLMIVGMIGSAEAASVTRLELDLVSRAETMIDSRSGPVAAGDLAFTSAFDGTTSALSSGSITINQQDPLMVTVFSAMAGQFTSSSLSQPSASSFLATFEVDLNENAVLSFEQNLGGFRATVREIGSTTVDDLLDGETRNLSTGQWEFQVGLDAFTDRTDSPPVSVYDLNGSATFAISTIPEPAVVLPLSLAGCLLLRRRKRSVT